MIKNLFLYLVTIFAIACGDPGTPSTERSTGRSALSSQGGAPTTSFAGVVDPTNAAFAGGMQSCTGSCSSALIAQNTAALQMAVLAASTQNRTVYVPAGTYPLARTAGQSYAIDFSGLPNVTIDAHNATFRQSGDAASTDFYMFWIRNTSGVRIYGPTFSQRDVVNPTTNTIAVLIGDGGATATDNTMLEDTAFGEGVASGGDFVRLDGGTTTTTVTRTSITSHCVFQNAARAAIDVRPGVQVLGITDNFFQANANRDVWFEGGVADAPIGQAIVARNVFDRTGSTTFEAVTLDGFGTATANDQSLFRNNVIVNGAVTGNHVQRAIIAQNWFQLDAALSGNAMLTLTGHTQDTWVRENEMFRGPNSTNGTVIRINSDVASSGIWVTANRVYQYSGSAAGIDMSGTARFQVTRNDVSYHHATADSGSTGFVGILCTGAATQACSGAISENKIKRRDQSVLASLDFATLGLTPALNTVVQAGTTVISAGTWANSIQVRLIGDAAAAAGTLSDGNLQVTIHFKPGTGGTTVAQLETLLKKSQYLLLKTAGTSQSLVLQAGDAFAFTNLAGGLQAGRMLAGVQVLKGAGTTTNGLTLRDNVVDGAQKGLWLDADGAAQWPEGYPVVTGNFLLNAATDIGGGITTWRTETTPLAETISTGALSVNKKVTFIAEASTQTYTLADGLVDGLIHYVKIKSFAGVTGTLTPAHMADGTAHTITWTAAGGFVALMWDATAATYRVVGSNNVVIN